MIDLRSDTVTRPSPGMRAAMAAAEVGDDVYGEDPAVNALQERAASLTGMEAALLVPSGTMANLIAILAQTRPGDSILLAEAAHPYHYESANLSAVAGVMPIPIPDPLGKIGADQVRERIVQIDDSHFSHTTLAAIENTTNRGGGAYYTLDEAEGIARVCRAHGLKLHCDGARIFNASAAANVPVSAYGRLCDSLSFCLSKGLGCPAGSLLCGSRAFIHQAHRFRKRLGGGMRQAGILAAAGLYALEHHVADLEEDHRRAQEFRAALSADGFEFPRPTPTNMVYLRAVNPFEVVAALAGQGVLVLPHDTDQIRAVFHRDISDADLAQAIAVFRKTLRPLLAG